MGGFHANAIETILESLVDLKKRGLKTGKQHGLAGSRRPFSNHFSPTSDVKTLRLNPIVAVVVVVVVVLVLVLVVEVEVEVEVVVVVLVVLKTLLRARSPLQAGVGGYVLCVKCLSSPVYFCPVCAICEYCGKFASHVVLPATSQTFQTRKHNSCHAGQPFLSVVKSFGHRCESDVKSLLVYL